MVGFLRHLACHWHLPFIKVITGTEELGPGDVHPRNWFVYSLGVDPSYVSRVARSERRSKVIEDAMRREVRKIVERVIKQRFGLGNMPGGKAVGKNVRTKTSVKRT